MKIRGFRIELGEIDTYLRGHELVDQCITLVRRDKYEEKTLVSYVVPQMGAWSEWLRGQGLQDEPDADGIGSLLRRFRALRDVVRNYLKAKLPAYAVPSTIIPLKRMPLNPNGKIDKPALPFPDVSELSIAAPKKHSTSGPAMTETESKLASIWANMLHINVETLSIDESFFDLGGDSIKGNMMVFEVRKTWRVEVSMNAIFRSPTLKAFALCIDKLRNPDNFVDMDSQSVSKEEQQTSIDPDEDYAADAKRLVRTLPQKFSSSDKLDLSRPITVFLTGATGFLGSYIIREILSRETPTNIVAHVRGKSPEIAISRVQETCKVRRQLPYLSHVLIFNFPTGLWCMEPCLDFSNPMRDWKPWRSAAWDRKGRVGRLDTIR